MLPAPALKCKWKSFSSYYLLICFRFPFTVYWTRKSRLGTKTTVRALYRVLHHSTRSTRPHFPPNLSPNCHALCFLWIPGFQHSGKEPENPQMVSTKQLLTTIESALLGPSPPSPAQRIELIHAIHNSLSSFKSLLSYLVYFLFFSFASLQLTKKKKRKKKKMLV